MNRFRSWTRHATSKYSLIEYKDGSFMLLRLADEMSAFFQGDDADLWEENMVALEEIERRNGWNAGMSLDSSFDRICDSYDSVLEPAEVTL